MRSRSRHDHRNRIPELRRHAEPGRHAESNDQPNP